MQKNIALENVLIIDLKTVSAQANYKDLPVLMQNEWKNLAQYHHIQPEQVEEYYKAKAGIYAEFGKIIGISVGMFFKKSTTDLGLRIKTFCEASEKETLTQFADLVENSLASFKQLTFCGHNLREFDIPFVSRRLCVHRLPLPQKMDIQNVKPWEAPLIDTIYHWRFTAFKHYVSLPLLAQTLEIPISSQYLSEKDIHDYFWQLNDTNSIVQQSKNDVATIAHILMHFLQLPKIDSSNIEYV
ncbi:MAG: hypothetical protein R2798_09570 [Chitinophagales bacterium]|nr:hypothetical protein [Bacteroidota bacterium]